MSKIIAVCGSPSSGKTTLALKLAHEIYFMCKGGRVIFLSADMTVPSMSYIFPHCKDEDLYSLGVALDKTDIFKEDILKQLVSVKTMRNFGYLGFKAKENKFSYPRPTEDKLGELFAKMSELADYIITDCSCESDNTISSFALSIADKVIRLVTPDLKSIGYFASQKFRYECLEDNVITVMNTTEKDVFLPLEEVKAHFKSVSATLPYSITLKQQTITGTLSERLSDSKYCGQVKGIAKRVI